MSGVSLRAEAWGPFMKSRQNVFMLPIIAHVPELLGEDFDPATMTDFEPELAIPACVDKMYVYWRKRRAKRPGGNIVHLTRTPVRVAMPPVIKVGRNDPCPCGSGKKFKKCCGGDVTPN